MGAAGIWRRSLLCAGTAFACLGAFSAPAEAAPPANDPFASAAVAGPALPVSAAGTNVEATGQSGEPNHTLFGSGPHHSVWYRWTPSQSRNVVIETCDANFDSLLAVYTGAAVNALSAVARSDDDCPEGQGSSVTIAAVAGTTYRIAVDGFEPGEDGTFHLVIRSLVPPANDNFANRQTVGPSLPIDISATNVDAGPEANEPGHLSSGAAANSVWYQWTAPATMHAEVDACGSAAAIAPAVYTGGTLETLGRIAGGADGCAVTFPAVAGTSYKIALDSLLEGATRMVIREHVGPANDNFSNRTAVGPALPAAASGTTVDATSETGEPDHIGFGGGAEWSIWYQWVPSAGGPVRVDTCGSESAVRPAVYTGSAVDSLTVVSRSNDQCWLTFNATAGTAYKIALDGFAPTDTELLIRTLSPPANDSFASRQTVGPSLPVNVAGNNLDATSQAGEPDHRTGAGPLHSIWYGWTPSASARVKVSVCGSDPDIPPVQTAVYTGSALASLTQVASSPDCALTFNATAGTSYKIAVDASGEGPTLLDIHVVSPPSNDNFANRRTIGPALPATTAATSVDATGEAGEPDHIGIGLGASRSTWYAWTPAATGPVTVDACASASEVFVAVYTGNSVGSLTPVAGESSCAASYTATAGTAYKIAVDGFVDSALSLTVSSSGPPPDPPDTPVLTGTYPGAGANDNSPRILGSAEAGSTVRIFTNSSCSGGAVATGTAADLSSPGIQVAVLDNSTTTFFASAQNADGFSGCSAGITYTEVTPPNSPSGLTVTPASGSNDNNPIVKGTAPAGTTVKVYANTACTGTPVATGTATAFSFTGFTVPVADNSTTTFRATAENANGTSSCSAASVTYAEVTPPPPPAAPTGLGVSPASGSNDNSPRVSGTAVAGTTVRIYTTASCTGSPVATGTAAQFASPGLAVSVADNSTTTFRATAENAGGTSACSTASVTYAEVTPASPPAAPTGLTVTPASGSDDNNPVIKGNAGAGTTVLLYVSSDCSGSPIASGQAANFASPGFPVTVADNSTTSFRARAQNANGLSPCSSPVTYTEVTPPPPPDPPAAPTGLTVTPPSGSNENSPEISGDAPAGTTVKLYATAACSGEPAATGTAAAFASPGFEVQVADNSTTTFHATATNEDGTSACSAGVTYAEVTRGQAPGGQPVDPPSGDPSEGPTGLRGVALKRCKKLKGKARAKCVKKAKKLPV